jgi:hypothetical protein
MLGGSIVGRLVTAASFTAVFYLVPAVAPFFAVLEGPAAGAADFGGQLTFAEGSGHWEG